jgi:hypothetical protein
MNHAKTSFSTVIFAGAIVGVVQYVAPLRYVILFSIGMQHGRKGMKLEDDSILDWSVEHYIDSQRICACRRGM